MSKSTTRRAPAGSRNGGPGRSGAAPLGFEHALWDAADVLRGSMDPAEYKHVVLGLIFLKYISDAFDQLAAGAAAPVDRAACAAASVCFVPPAARWSELRRVAGGPAIGAAIDRALAALADDDPRLAGAVAADYARPALDQHRLGALVELLSGVELLDRRHRTRDLLGRVYEYFLARFASAEGRLGGDFYTPRAIVRVLVEMLQPIRGTVYDPCCGSGGMFVQSERFLAAHGGAPGDLSVFGQEWNPTTWRLARMNLAIRGIAADLGPAWANSLHRDLHAGRQADYVLANPPFNVSDWGSDELRDDARWCHGVPPPGNANFAWLQHVAHHLAPGGIAGVVLSNGSMASQQAQERAIRQAMIEADLVDCMVALPGQLFYATQIPVCLWLLARDKADRRFRDRRGEVLFIDARRLGALVDRTHRELADAEIARIAGTYHAWRAGAAGYTDVAGFCRGARRDEIRAHGWVLTPGRFVGPEQPGAADEPFDQRLAQLSGELAAQFAEAARLSATITELLGELRDARD